MSEAATVQPNEAPQAQDRQALIDAAWAEAGVEEVDAPTNDGPALPSREEASAPAKPAEEQKLTREGLDERPPSAVGGIREFLKAQKQPPAPEGLEAEVIELRAALNALREAGQAPAKPKTESQQILERLEKYEQLEAQRQQEAAQAAAQAAHDERMKTLRQGARVRLESMKEDYPALFALEQEDVALNELFARLDRDEDTSEEEVASEIHNGLFEIWQKLNPVFAGQSKATPARSESQTISGTLSGHDEEADTSKMTRQELIDYAWEKASRIA